MSACHESSCDPRCAVPRALELRTPRRQGPGPGLPAIALAGHAQRRRGISAAKRSANQRVLQHSMRIRQDRTDAEECTCVGYVLCPRSGPALFSVMTPALVCGVLLSRALSIRDFSSSRQAAAGSQENGSRTLGFKGHCCGDPPPMKGTWRA